MIQTSLLTPAKTAELLGMSEGTLACWRCEHRGPTYFKIGGKVKYRLEELNRWIEGQRREPARDARPVAVPVSSSRPQHLGRHRLGGYRTKQEKSRAYGIGSSASDHGGPVGIPAGEAEILH